MSAQVDLEVRTNVRKRLWDSVSELSDIELQKRTWGKVDNPHFTFVEFVECYFDCIPKGVDDAVAVGLISEDEASVLRRLDARMIGYRPPKGDSYAEAAVLKDGAWLDTVRVASEVRLSLLRVVTDPEERSLLQPAEAQTDQ